MGTLALDFEWLSWKSQHKFSFGENEEFRYKIFSENRNYVKVHNERAAKGLESYTVKLNKFAAMDNEEFYEKYLTLKRSTQDDPTVGINYDCDGIFFEDDGSDVPDAISYVTNDPDNVNNDNRVTMVKDQGSCGSCWTFGASSAIENLLCQGTKDCTTWTGLATQQMVDCASYTHNSDDPNVIDLFPYDNHGCNGGLEPNAIRYVQLAGGQNNWDDYPYVSGQTKT